MIGETWSVEDHTDAAAPSRELRGSASQDSYRTAIAAQKPEGAFQGRGLAGTVESHETADAPRLNLQINASERACASEGLLET